MVSEEPSMKAMEAELYWSKMTLAGVLVLFFALLAVLAQLALLVVNEGAAAEFYYKKS